MEPFKLHVEVNGNRFDGEGPAELVKEMYQSWLASIANKAAAAPAGAKLTPDPAKHDNPPPGALEGLYKRVFVERDGVISLQALPADNGDALLLLLHGYQRLKPDEYPVTAVRLMQAAKMSGVNLDRLDRGLSSKGDFLMKSGFKRSTRYSLNNRGEQLAIDTMKTLFD